MLEDVTSVDEINESGAGAGAEAPAKPAAPGPVPYSRFQEIVKQKNDLANEVNALKVKLNAAESAKIDAEAAARTAAEEKQAAVAEETQRVAAVEAVLSTYKQTLSSIVDETTKDWPAELLAFDPGADADPLKRMDWVKNGAAMAAKLSQVIPAATGMAPKPSPAGTKEAPKNIKLPVDVRRSF
jgi:hypothetical protein